MNDESGNGSVISPDEIEFLDENGEKKKEEDIVTFHYKQGNNIN